MINFWNRYTNREETESVYGGSWVRLVYSPYVFWFADFFLTAKWISKVYGWYQSIWLSRHKVAPFVEKFQINMAEFEERNFTSFNDFFVRKFRPNARSFNEDALAAPAEARYLGFPNSNEDLQIPVKGLVLRPEEILGPYAWTKRFLGGPVLVARLCPVDYHRFHYPTDGRMFVAPYSLGTKLHSVNPTALRADPQIFSVNERVVSVLETAYGLIGYVEVGALCVGKIVQSNTRETFKQGEEKGYFLFGGSTVILFGEPKRWTISPDILANTAKGLETFVRLGDTVAKKT
jgi:phosphatidylserine decarboxylase